MSLPKAESLKNNLISFFYLDESDLKMRVDYSDDLEGSSKLQSGKPLLHSVCYLKWQSKMNTLIRLNGPKYLLSLKPEFFFSHFSETILCERISSFFCFRCRLKMSRKKGGQTVFITPNRIHLRRLNVIDAINVKKFKYVPLLQIHYH